MHTVSVYLFESFVGIYAKFFILFSDMSRILDKVGIVYAVFAYVQTFLVRRFFTRIGKRDDNIVEFSALFDGVILFRIKSLSAQKLSQIHYVAMRYENKSFYSFASLRKYGYNLVAAHTGNDRAIGFAIFQGYKTVPATTFHSVKPQPFGKLRRLAQRIFGYIASNYSLDFAPDKTCRADLAVVATYVRKHFALYFVDYGGEPFVKSQHIIPCRYSL